MPTTLPEPKPPPSKRRDARTNQRTGFVFFLGAITAGIPLVAHTARVERRAMELEAGIIAASGAAQAAKSSAEAARKKADAQGQETDARTRELESAKARMEMHEAQLKAVTGERDAALRRAGCKNRHIEAKLPDLIANLVDAENRRAEACRQLAHPAAP